MNVKETLAIVDEYADLIEGLGWKFAYDFCPDTQGQVVCITLCVSRTEFVQPVKENCCEPMDYHRYEADGQYAVVKGEVTERGTLPVTEEALRAALDILLEYVGD